MAPDINQTIRNFGYPATLVADLGPWLVLLRPRQITLGSLILAANDPATAFGALPATTLAALGDAVVRVERALAKTFAYDKINYLMLMMVDPHVHFHVVPRYATPVAFGGQSYPDAAWPKPPVMSDALVLSDAAFEELRTTLAAAFSA